MGVAVTEQLRPQSRVGDPLQPAPRARAGHMLEVPQLSAGPQERIQVSQHADGIAHRAQHQRAHHRVKRVRLAERLRSLLHHDDRHRCRVGRGAGLGGQPRLGLHRDHQLHGRGVIREIRSHAGAHLPSGVPISPT